MPDIVNLAEQYTNSVFNSKVFVELLLIKVRIISSNLSLIV